jgi:hypothetical protein
MFLEDSVHRPYFLNGTCLERPTRSPWKVTKSTGPRRRPTLDHQGLMDHLGRSNLSSKPLITYKPLIGLLDHKVLEGIV